MANAYFYSNTAVQATLSGSISSGATSVTVDFTTGFPGSFPYVLALDYGTSAEELVKVTNAAGTTLTVTRGFGGTSATSHSLGAVVRHVANAQDLTDFRTHEVANSGVHGLTGAVVGTSDVQTLTGKTLTSPQINNASMAGTWSGSPTFSGAPTFSGVAALGSPSISSFTNATHNHSTSAQGGPLASVTVQPLTAAGVPLTIAGATSQTGNLLTVQDVSANPLVRIDSSGTLRLTPPVGFDATILDVPTGAGDMADWRQAGSTKFRVDNGGNLAQAANISTTTWTSYTPQWTAPTTNPTVGNGSLVGAYCQIGRTYIVRIELVTNTTTTFGSGQYAFSLPTTASSGNITVGHGHGITSGARWLLNGIITTGGQNTMAVASTVSSADNRIVFLASTAGMGGIAWASGQTMRMTIVYESAT